LPRRTPSTLILDARGDKPGEDPARPAATVGLVSPPGGIVLWDEWLAALKPRGDGEHPETRSTLKKPAEISWLQHKKEVIGDQDKK
jgi:hypothetical protein